MGRKLYEPDVQTCGAANAPPTLSIRCASQSMATRLEDVPVIKIKPAVVSSEVYNTVRLAIIRLEKPLRLSLPGLRGMDITLDDDVWVCVDRTLYDLPVIAWTLFEKSTRNSLHEPIGCQVNYYHIHANVIAETVLCATRQLLDQRLRPYPAREFDHVLRVLEVK